MEGQDALLRQCVMNAMADDYENPEHIMNWVAKSMSSYGIQISYKHLVEVLKQLVEEGYAQAYRLSPEPPHFTPVSCSVGDPSDLWFYLTPKGLSAVKKRMSLWEGSRN